VRTNAGDEQERLAGRVSELYVRDPQFREAMPDPEVSRAVRELGLTLSQVVERLMAGYADRPALGQRVYEIASDSRGKRVRRLVPKFQTMSYGEVWTTAGAVAGEWRSHPDAPLRPDDFFCTLGFSSPEYVVLDVAGIRAGLVSVPLQTGAAVAQLAKVVNDARPALFAVSLDYLERAVEVVLACMSIRRLVVFDYCDEADEERELLEAARQRFVDNGRRVFVDSFSEIVKRGGSLPVSPLQLKEGCDDGLSMLIYTSGSTGSPKGAIRTRRYVKGLWAQTVRDFPSILAHFMPLSHTSGRVHLMGALSGGGTVFFFAKNDLSTFFEDLPLIRPTVFPVVPRVCELVHGRFLAEVASRGAGEPVSVEGEVMTMLRKQMLGGRVLLASSSAAPLSAELKSFMETLLDLHLSDNYGSTEAGVVWIDGRVQKPPVVDYKLVDLPDLGYYSTDRPYPRGELLLKTNSMITGYYNRPDLTAEIFDEYGYYKTGDVVAEVSPDVLEFVDRRTSVLKLSQGEFVATAKLESQYSTSPWVRQIYIYGSSERSFLVAVVVPSGEALRNFADDEELKIAIKESLRTIAKRGGLQGYEVPRDFLLERTPFSNSNGLLSDLGKLIRPNLKAVYGSKLEQLYASMEAAQQRELANLCSDAGTRPVVETVVRAAAGVLGFELHEIRYDAHFIDLGGDSLSMLAYSNLLEEIFRVEVPVGFIAGSAITFASISEYIQRAWLPEEKRATFSAVHGSNAESVRARDLKLDKFLEAGTLAMSQRLSFTEKPVRRVMLTGANGWLGRFIALELLQSLAPLGGKLVCLVRGDSEMHARSRLDRVFEGMDPSMSACYREFGAEVLEIACGDVGEKRLGLGPDAWEREIHDVDLIVHAAAQVNHLFPYSQLFRPNVAGTAEVINLAISGRIKPISYISTVAVALHRDSSSNFQEDGDIRLLCPEYSLGGRYGSGYAISKWAGEVLLREAHDICGVPVCVFRSNMLLAHRRYVGQLNLADQFTRLIFSVLATGLAPSSFYELDCRGERQRAHYDGLPVDFIAEAVATLGIEGFEGHHSYNVFNPHHDGVSLDVFVDWLVELGHDISRVDDYQEWLHRFEAALRGLHEEKRKYSLLPLLSAFNLPAQAEDGCAYPVDSFRAAVRSHKIGSKSDIPCLSRDLIHKYVTDLHAHKLLEEPLPPGASVRDVAVVSTDT
jgi:fatty acid CoA ligase FadD9